MASYFLIDDISLEDKTGVPILCNVFHVITANPWVEFSLRKLHLMDAKLNHQTNVIIHLG